MIDFSTESTSTLCSEVAQMTDSTCILGFSRGKDAIAAFLYLRKFFNRIIPFHVCCVPGISFVEGSLAYYEQWFGVKIDRFIDGAISNAISRLYFQPIEDEPMIDSINWWTYGNHGIVEILRRKYNVKKSWCAYGINATDSIDRRIYVNKYKGKIESRRSFYPCYDWKKTDILGYINAHGIKLPKDYTIANRSFSGSVPSLRHLYGLRSKFPKDFEKIKLWFPFIESIIARNEFRKMHFEKQEESQTG